jgi:hypothetical protein
LVPEIGPEGHNGFDYGPPIPGLVNDYQGLSDGIIPEPSTMALAGLGALGMIGYAVRRRKVLGA